MTPKKIQEILEHWNGTAEKISEKYRRQMIRNRSEIKYYKSFEKHKLIHLEVEDPT